MCIYKALHRIYVMKVKINAKTKEIEAEITSPNDIALLKQLVKDNEIAVNQIREEHGTPEQSNQMQAITEQPITEQSQPITEQPTTQRAYFAQTPEQQIDLTKLPKNVTSRQIYRELFRMDAPKNITKEDPNGHTQVRKAINSLVKQGKLKYLGHKVKHWINTESVVPAKVREQVKYTPDTPVMETKLDEKPHIDVHHRRHPTAEWQPFSTGWFKDTILPKLPYRFGYNDGFKATYHYSSIGKYDPATKSKYAKVYNVLTRLAKQGVLKKEKFANRTVSFTKLNGRPYTPSTETPKLVWSDIPIIKQQDLEDILQNYQSFGASVFIGRTGRYGKKIEPNEATVIMNFLLENVPELAKLTGRTLKVTGFGQWRALEIGG